MKNALTIHQREYVLFHLAQSLELSSTICEKCVFSEQKDGHICFYQHDKELNENEIISIDNIPILFPGNNKNAVYTFKEGTLVFHHDLLRSAFYLLSGLQEYKSDQKDMLGRFPHEASIQYRLGVLQKPVVNYYFEWIKEGIKEYCSWHGIPFVQRRVFEKFGFFLTHDIDRIDKYHFQTCKNQLKKKKLKEFIIYLFKWLKPIKKENPYWSFNYILDINKRYGFRSTFFFLNKGVPHIDSYYRYGMKRIARLIQHLEAEDCEIGLHGTVQSADHLEIMQQNLKELKKVTAKIPVGNRQHRLSYEHPLTMSYLTESGLRYDTTLCYAGHEGFRNSYCLPFHLYDFEKDEMMQIWEIPLIVMDGTLFDYRGLSYDNAKRSVENIVREISRFHGIFTLLWHNSYFDEDVKPGIGQFYESLLHIVYERGGESLRGKDIVEKCDAE